MSAHSSNEIFHTCYGNNLRSRGAVAISHPGSEQFVQTRDVSCCFAFGFVIRDENSAIIRIAMIHSMSEHLELGRPEYPISFYESAINRDMAALEDALYSRAKDGSFVNMLAYILHGIDRKHTKLTIYAATSDSIRDQTLDDESKPVVLFLEELGYTVERVLVKIKGCCSIDGNGNFSESYVEEDKYSEMDYSRQINEIDTLLKALQDTGGPLSTFFRHKNRETIKIEFLTQLKEIYQNYGHLASTFIPLIYKVLSDKHHVSVDNIESTVREGILSHRVEDFLCKEGLTTRPRSSINL